MNENSHLLTYCGLYCGDCARHTLEISDAAKALQEILERYNFDQTAKYLLSEELKHYDNFRENIRFLSRFVCPTICRERKDDSTTCKIRKCCRDRGFYACYECDDFEVCERLMSLQRIVGISPIENLKAIKEMGLETWMIKGERHLFGASDAVM